MVEYSAKPKVGDAVTVAGSVCMMGASTAFPHIAHTVGLVLFYGGLAVATIYPSWRWGWHYFCVWRRGKSHQEGITQPTGGNAPIWRAVAHVRVAINDHDHSNCYPRTLTALRQAGADAKIIIRGRPEIDTSGPQTFSAVSSDIPAEYWKVSVLGAMATSELHHGNNMPHTNPESVWAWGPKGVHEKKHYSDLTVNMNDIKRIWPSAE